MRRKSRRCLRRSCILCLALIVAIATTSHLYAGIVSSTNVTVLGGPPAPNVHPGSQLPPTPIIFPELPGIGTVTAAGGLPVDHDGSNTTANPVVTPPALHANLVPTTIAVGTKFESYFFHFDPIDADASPANFYGDPGGDPLSAIDITFSTPIIGVQLFSSAFPGGLTDSGPYTGTLEDGDAEIAALANGGPPLAYYPGGLGSRGLEEDAMTISNGSKTITLSGKAFGSEIDQLRIIVAIPEPASAMLASMGLLGLLFLGITRVGAKRHS